MEDGRRQGGEGVRSLKRGLLPMLFTVLLCLFFCVVSENKQTHCFEWFNFFLKNLKLIVGLC